MTKLQDLAGAAGATLPMEDGMILSRDISPWKAEQLYVVSKPVGGADMVALNGSYVTKVFNGPYKNVAKWQSEMQNLVIEHGSKVTDIYFFYTTCPKCAKHYGVNYVIGFAKLS